MGICAYCSCPNTASSAPYLRIILLIAAIAATRLICERKLVMPNISIRLQTFPRKAKSPAAGLMILMCSRYHTARIAVAT